MFVLTKKSPNQDLVQYLNNDIIQSVQHDGKTFSFQPSGAVRVKASGLIKRIKAIYYPEYQYKKKKQFRKTKSQRKGSTKKQGIQIDNQLSAYIQSGYNKKKLRHRHAKKLVEYWEDNLNHKLQAAQVPVHVKALNAVTCADIITSDKDNKLFLWEVKSGANASKKQGDMIVFGAKVKNNRHNHWELQRYFTTQGLIDYGLNLSGSHVINVFDEKTGVTVHRRKRPAWCNK